MSLYLVQTSYVSKETEIYRLDSPMLDADERIRGYMNCSKIADNNGKTFAVTASWIPIALVVRKYGEASAQEAQEAADYNTALDALLEIEADKERARIEYEKTH
jgi:hypothetical protein